MTNVPLKDLLDLLKAVPKAVESKVGENQDIVSNIFKECSSNIEKLQAQLTQERERRESAEKILNSAKIDMFSAPYNVYDEIENHFAKYKESE